MGSLTNILFIDDDRDFCSLLTLVVKKEGLSSDCAYTLNDSTRKIEETHPQLIILDNNLPDGRGIEFYLANKQLFKHSRVWMITADPASDLQKLAMENGVSVFLSKPVLLKEFKEIIRQYAW